MALSATSQQPNNNGEIQELESFPQFDVVSDSSDHSFAAITTGKNPNCFTNLSSGVHKKIMQEWKILEKNLPDSIFVRVYENRVDLLRAVIIGAAGTPYHDGLFFFDIAFPSNYPTRPPNVSYKSYGLQINPNLYASGRVCLSLINTWMGRKSENWNPNESTVLQLLVSIQALVLNEKPYFNELSHGMWPSKAIRDKKSNFYNEDVFVLCCKTTLFLLRAPPKNFESFVGSHFRERAEVILSACIAYTSGEAKVGYYKNDMSSANPVEVSEKFKGSIKGLYSELVVGFTMSGASLGDFVEHLVVENETVSCKTQVANSGIARKVFGKLKKVLGLKKKSGKSKKKTTSSS